MRLIDADALIEQIKKLRCIDCDNYNGVRCRACEYDDEMADIDDAPAVFELPNNATNGDILKALFPNNFSLIGDDNVLMYFQTFDMEWWNSPYERR